MSSILRTYEEFLQFGEATVYIRGKGGKDCMYTFPSEGLLDNIEEVENTEGVTAIHLKTKDGHFKFCFDMESKENKTGSEWVLREIEVFQKADKGYSPISKSIKPSELLNIKIKKG